jgi:hypothetical protein
MKHPQKKKNFVIPSRNFARGNFTTKKKKNWSSGTICHHPSHSLPPKSFPQCFGNDLSPHCTSFPPTCSRQTLGTPTPPYFPLSHLAPTSHVTCRPRQTKHTTTNERNVSLLTKHYSLPTPNLSSCLGLGKPRYLNPYPIAAFKPHLPKKMRSNYSLCDGKKYLCVWLPKMVLNQYIQHYKQHIYILYI